MSRFSAGVAPRTSVTWSSQLLPKIVTTGVSAATSSRRFGSSAGPVRAVAGRAEGGQLRALPAHRPGGGEELDVLGVRARPAALDEGMPNSSSIRAIAQLVGEREGDVLALGAVAQGRVVEDDRSVVAGRRARSCRHASAAAPAAERRSTTARRRSAGRARPRRGRSAALAPARGEVGRPEAGVEGRGRRPPRPPSAASARPSDSRRSIAADRIVPIGLARSCPAMSGAEPWIGSYRPNVPWAVRRSPSDADGSMPERAGQDRRLVGQDVAEQVLGHEHVERGRAADEQHRAASRRAGGSSATSGYSARDLVDDRPPQARRRQDVRLVDAGEPAGGGRGPARRRAGRRGRSRPRSTAACRWRASARRARRSPRCAPPK